MVFRVVTWIIVIIGAVRALCENAPRVMPSMFPLQLWAAITSTARKPVDRQQAKEAKWGSYWDATVREIAQMESVGWVPASTRDSAKTVGGGGQAGYGVFFEDASLRNHRLMCTRGEPQSVSRGELRGVLHALLHRRKGERLLVVMDLEYIFKGITEWSVKWCRHLWRSASRKVRHRDFWEQILWERERAGVCAVTVDPLPFRGAGKSWSRCFGGGGQTATSQ